MARSYRQLSEEERKIADGIWWVQFRDLDDDLFYGEGETLYAMFDLQTTGQGIAWFCVDCRTVNRHYRDAEGMHRSGTCRCQTPRRIKVYTEKQAAYLEGAEPLAERFANERNKD